ncbi:Uncharacterised protein [Serratia quinivorans]|nr:Uncharacterised protein [Serratia quinivorans]
MEKCVDHFSNVFNFKELLQYGIIIYAHPFQKKSCDQREVMKNKVSYFVITYPVHQILSSSRAIMLYRVTVR